MQERLLDARGLACPLPVINLKKALEELGSGTVRVLVDSPVARDNVRRFAESQGCRVSLRDLEGGYELVVVKEEGPRAEQTAAAEPVVLIGSDGLGVGDERLGRILMKAFLNTLWDAKPKPRCLIFINRGVMLTAEGSEALEVLGDLEAQGVEILSCGTCLDYYGIKDKLRVGRTTNMFEVVQCLLSASKVVRI